MNLHTFRYQYPGFLFPGKTQLSEGDPPPNLEIRKSLHSVNVFSWFKTAAELIREKPDLVIIHYWMPFFSPLFLFLIKRIKTSCTTRIVLLAHNLIPHESQPGSVWLTRKLLERIDGIVTLSASVEKDALKLSPNLKSRMLLHPVYDVYGNKIARDEACKALGLDIHKRYILFFGLVRKYKGLDLLLKAMASLEDPDVKLIVAGEFYENPEIYKELIMSEGIKDRVGIIDQFIPDDEVKNYFSMADLVVQPYRSATQSGITQIAIHFGTPMIVTGVGGLREIVDHGKNGYICEPDPLSIAESINLFYRQGNYASFSRAQINKQKEFSWNYFGEKFLEFCEEL